MAMDKAIESGKEHRKQYMKLCEQIDKTCRCHGGCKYCLSNRFHKFNIRQDAMDFREQEYNDERGAN